VKDTIYQLIVFQGVVLQFKEESVRTAFLAGEFGVPNCDQRTLLSIDTLSKSLTPSPLQSRTGYNKAARTGVDIFAGLLKDCETEVLGQDGNPLLRRWSHGAWSEFFNQISDSGLSDHRKTHWKQSSGEIRH